MRLPLILAASVAIAAPALAQDATGDWVGKVRTPGAELTITVQVKSGANGALEAVAGSPDQSLTPLPLTEVVAKDGAFSFAAPIVNARFASKWDARASGWAGTFTQSGYEMPLTLVRGKPGPRPTIAGLDGAWAGTLAAPQGDLRVRVRVATGADGTLALFTSPDQGPQEMVAHVSREGDLVGFQLRGLGGFEGKLAPDGGSITGEWRQGGGVLPLTLTKAG